MFNGFRAETCTEGRTDGSPIRVKFIRVFQRMPSDRS